MSQVNFHLLIVSYGGEGQLPGTCFRMEKYCSQPKLSRKYIKLHCAPKIYLLLHLGYVLRTKTKLLRELNFDLYQASEVKILNFENCECPFFRNFWPVAIFKIQYLRPSIYRASRGKGNIYGISNNTVYRISIYISLLIKVANSGNENGAR